MKLKTIDQGAPPDTVSAVRAAIEAAIEGAEVSVQGAGGHFSVEVVSGIFEGKSRLEAQRLVLRAIAPLMAGDAAPVHAIDSLKTSTGRG